MFVRFALSRGAFAVRAALVFGCLGASLPASAQKLIPELDPRNIPGVAAWLDATNRLKLKSTNSNSGPQANDGEQVLRWRAEVGSDFTGGAPIFEPKAGNGRLPALQFTGSDTFTSVSPVTLASEFTVLFAFRASRLGLNQNLVQVGKVGGVQLRLSAANQLQLNVLGQGAIVVGKQVWNTQDWAVVTADYNGTTGRLFVNGSLDAARAMPGFALGAGNILIGYKNSGNEPLSGGVMGMAIFNRVLTDGERKGAEKYFANRLGLQTDITYVDSVKGSSTAVGYLPSEPKLSVNDAIAQRTSQGNGTIEIVAPQSNPIRECIRLSGNTPSINFQAQNGQPWYVKASNLHTGGWLPGEGYWYKDVGVANVRSAWVETQQNSVSQPHRLRKYTAGPLPPGAGYFTMVGTELRLRLQGDANPNFEQIEVSVRPACIWLNRTNVGLIKVNDGRFFGGNEAAAYVTAGQIYFENCWGQYAQAGFGTEGEYSNTTLVRCHGRNNYNDGFNLHAKAGVPSVMQLYGCEAWNNEDEGVSPHNDTKMYIYGGNFCENGHGGFTSIDNAYAEIYNANFNYNRPIWGDPGEGGISFKARSSGKVSRCVTSNNGGSGLFRLYPARVIVEEHTSFGNRYPDQ